MRLCLFILFKKKKKYFKKIFKMTQLKKKQIYLFLQIER